MKLKIKLSIISNRQLLQFSITEMSKIVPIKTYIIVEFIFYHYYE